MYDELAKSLRICDGACNKECVLYNSVQVDGDTCQNRLCAMAADAIEELTAIRDEQKAQIILMAAEIEEQQPRWIPATERLPDYGTTVLVYGSQGGIYTARYERARAEWGRDSWWKLNSKSHICNPTHWMPLPQPPKEET